MNPLNRDRARISLRIQHPSRPAADRCRALPFAPRRTWDVGAPRTNPEGVPPPGYFADTDATFPLSDGAGPPAEDVSAAAERVALHRDQLRAWQAEGGACAFFVGWFMEGGQSGDLFEPELLGRLGIGLSLDIDS